MVKGKPRESDQPTDKQLLKEFHDGLLFWIMFNENPIFMASLVSISAGASLAITTNAILKRNSDNEKK